MIFCFPCFYPCQVHVDQELLIYEAFPYDQQQSQNNLKVRFKKVRDESLRSRLPHIYTFWSGTRAHLSRPQMPHNINFREKKMKLSKKDKKAEGGPGEEGLGPRGRVARFRYFEDISGYSGVRCSFTSVGVTLLFRDASTAVNTASRRNARLT